MIEPDTITQPGETITFSVKIGDEVNEKKPKYLWTVSEGIIIEGQNTSMIKVATTPAMSGSVITAKIVIDGLSDNCVNEASGTNMIAEVVIACNLSFDEYSKLPLKDEFVRLDNFINGLQNNPSAKGFIHISIDETESAEKSKKHIRKLAKHFKFRKFEIRDRVVFVIEKSDHHVTRLDIFPENAKHPECKDCEFIKGEDVN